MNNAVSQSLGEVAWAEWSAARGHDRAWEQISLDIRNDWQRVATAVLAAHGQGLKVEMKELPKVEDPNVIRGTGGSK